MWPEINQGCFCGPDQCRSKFCGQKSTRLVFVVSTRKVLKWHALAALSNQGNPLGGQKVAQRVAPVGPLIREQRFVGAANVPRGDLPSSIRGVPGTGMMDWIAPTLVGPGQVVCCGKGPDMRWGLPTPQFC